MTVRHRTFGARPERDEPEPDPITFTVEGRFATSGDRWSETFTVVPVAPGGVLDDVARMVGVDGRGKRVWNAPSVMKFLTGVLIEPDVARFDDLVHDKERLVELEALGEITEWVSEQLFNPRPTQPSSS